RLTDSFNENRRKRDVLPFTLLITIFDPVSPANKVGHICFDKRSHVRRGFHTLYHVVGNQLTHTIHFHYLIARGSNLWCYLWFFHGRNRGLDPRNGWLCR